MPILDAADYSKMGYNFQRRKFDFINQVRTISWVLKSQIHLKDDEQSKTTMIFSNLTSSVGGGASFPDISPTGELDKFKQQA